MGRACMIRGVSALAASLALGLLGCATTDTGATTATTSGTGSEFREDPLSSESPGDVIGQETPVSELQAVYFDFDRYEIREDAKPVLRSNAEAIRGNQQWGVVVIEGHCDERGSEEYNLALGERRARAVKQYLSDLGVPQSRVEVVSFGEAKPAVMGHDESAWRYNRRSEFTAR